MERCDRLELIRRIIRAQEHAQFQGSDRIASRTAIAIDDAIFEALGVKHDERT
jgi:hypothetical protein